MPPSHPFPYETIATPVADGPPRPVIELVEILGLDRLDYRMPRDVKHTWPGNK